MNKGWKFVFLLGVVALLLALFGACGPNPKTPILDTQTTDTHWTKLADNITGYGLFRYYDVDYGIVCYLKKWGSQQMFCVAVGE